MISAEIKQFLLSFKDTNKFCIMELRYLKTRLKYQIILDSNGVV
jgi:hypothetical protein